MYARPALKEAFIKNVVERTRQARQVDAIIKRYNNPLVERFTRGERAFWVNFPFSLYRSLELDFISIGMALPFGYLEPIIPRLAITRLRLCL